MYNALFFFFWHIMKQLISSYVRACRMLTWVFFGFFLYLQPYCLLGELYSHCPFVWDQVKTRLLKPCIQMFITFQLLLSQILQAWFIYFSVFTRYIYLKLVGLVSTVKETMLYFFFVHLLLFLSILRNMSGIMLFYTKAWKHFFFCSISILIEEKKMSS